MTWFLMTLMIPEGGHNFLIRHSCHLIKANFARLGQHSVCDGFVDSFVHAFKFIHISGHLIFLTDLIEQSHRIHRS